MFTANDIQARLQEKPFMPLRIVTSSGQSYDITHPELVLVGKRWLMIGTPNNDYPTIFETVSRVSMLHITDLQDMPHAASSGNNGAVS